MVLAAISLRYFSLLVGSPCLYFLPRRLGDGPINRLIPRDVLAILCVFRLPLDFEARGVWTFPCMLVRSGAVVSGPYLSYKWAAYKAVVLTRYRVEMVLFSSPSIYGSVVLADCRGSIVTACLVHMYISPCLNQDKFLSRPFDPGVSFSIHYPTWSFRSNGDV